jgi:phenylacetate-coenzyme A ligase PaaK-like adenylate-forming protein
MQKFSPAQIFFESEAQFDRLALTIFRHQYEQVKVYQEFVDLLKVNPKKVENVTQIPFLPIQAFKYHNVMGAGLNSQVTFKSSGTTGGQRSAHFVHDTELYISSFSKAFERFYGSIKEYTILALLPSYLEQGESSLVFMVDSLIKQSENPESGFYLNNYSELVAHLKRLDGSGKKVLLIGVTYALLDLIEHNQFRLQNTIVMETGGMKGRRKEMIKEELHEVLRKGFGVDHIHSEYGMTELLSQAYSVQSGVFTTPPWMRVITRDASDPLTLVDMGVTGGMNVIDLANYYSCAFIATQDLGVVHSENTFSIIGRFDDADVRGCNLLLA